MDPALVAHSLVAAHDDRLQELARLYGELEHAVTAGSANGGAAREVHRTLRARIATWVAADLAAELRDVVALAADERGALLRETRRALAHAERHADGLPATAVEHAVVASLRQIQTGFPTSLTRAALVRVRRSVARLARLEVLGAPHFVLGSEAGVLLGAFESATAPAAPLAIELDPEDGFHRTFAWSLEACLILDPGAAGAADLGLGTSPVVSTLLRTDGDDPDELYERWLGSLDPSHPFARYPYVPRGRFCSTSPEREVRSDLDSTGPIGWATAREAAILAGDLRAIAGEKPAFASELQAVAERVTAAADLGHAVIGWIEYLPAEAEGRRTWLTDPEADLGE